MNRTERPTQSVALTRAFSAFWHVTHTYTYTLGVSRLGYRRPLSYQNPEKARLSNVREARSLAPRNAREGVMKEKGRVNKCLRRPFISADSAG